MLSIRRATSRSAIALVGSSSRSTRAPVLVAFTISTIWRRPTGSEPMRAPGSMSTPNSASMRLASFAIRRRSSSPKRLRSSRPTKMFS